MHSFETELARIEVSSTRKTFEGYSWMNVTALNVTESVLIRARRFISQQRESALGIRTRSEQISTN